MIVGSVVALHVAGIWALQCTGIYTVNTVGSSTVPWVLQRDTDADTVTQALQRLVEFGTVRVRRTPDGRRLYIATPPPAARRTH